MTPFDETVGSLRERVADLQSEADQLRAGLKRALELLAHERQAREAAEEAARRAWRLGLTRYARHP
jgi:hypothetical protein